MNKNSIIALTAVFVLVMAFMSCHGKDEQTQQRAQKRIDSLTKALEQAQKTVDSLKSNTSLGSSELDQIQFSQQLQEDADAAKAQMKREIQSIMDETKRLKEQLNSQGKLDKELKTKLENEEKRSKDLLAQLENTKATDTVEIMRLKGELGNLQSLMQGYVAQIDELNQQNHRLNDENQSLRSANATAEQEKTQLATEKAALTEKVAIASQLDATGVSGRGLNKRTKTTEKIKDVKKIEVHFNISRNVTASAGNRPVYVRIITPTGAVLTQGGTFSYENKNLEYSMKKDIEYTGEETSLTLYWDVNETLSAGTYRADIFADGHNIGSTTFSFR